jgi:hypothetical protein
MLIWTLRAQFKTNAEQLETMKAKIDPAKLGPTLECVSSTFVVVLVCFPRPPPKVYHSKNTATLTTQPYPCAFLSM